MSEDTKKKAAPALGVPSLVPATGAADDKAAGADGDKATGTDGDKAAGTDGDKATGADGDKATGAAGDKATGADGDKATGADGDKAAGADAAPETASALAPAESGPPQDSPAPSADKTVPLEIPVVQQTSDPPPPATSAPPPGKEPRARPTGQPERVATPIKGPPLPKGAVERFDLVVIPVIAVLLLVGWGIGEQLRQAMASHTSVATGVTLDHPVGWIGGETADPEAGELAIIEYMDPYSPGAAKTLVTLRVSELDAELMAFGWENFVAINHAEDHPLYSELSSEEVSIAGVTGRRLEYAYAWRETGSGDVPVIIRAVDLIAVKGDRMYTATFTAESSHFADNRVVMEQILSSVVIP